MGLRFRKSINLGEGIRLNFSRSGVGISAGKRGMRVGIGPIGLRTSVGIPGTGVYYEKRMGLDKTKKIINNDSQRSRKTQNISLSFFKALTLPPAEKDLIEGINALLKDDMETTKEALNNALLKDSSLADASFIMAMISDDSQTRFDNIENVFSNIDRFREHFDKYQITVGGILQVTDELKVTIFNDKLGLILLSAEIYQDVGDINRAIELLNLPGLRQERLVKLSSGELYYQSGAYKGCIELFDDMENVDEISTVALLYVGLSFKELELYTSAVETLRKALRRKKNRSQEVLLTCRFELAGVFEAMGDTKKAKAEYEKIVAEAPHFRDSLEKAEKL